MSETIIYHHEQDGISNGCFKLFIFTKFDINWSLPKSTSSTLEAVLHPKFRVIFVPLPKKGELQTYLGLIEWKNCFKPIIASFLYDSDRAVKRNLNLKEVYAVLDFPLDKTNLMTDTQLKILGLSPKPEEETEAIRPVISKPCLFSKTKDGRFKFKLRS